MMSAMFLLLLLGMSSTTSGLFLGDLTIFERCTNLASVCENPELAESCSMTELCRATVWKLRTIMGGEQPMGDVREEAPSTKQDEQQYPTGTEPAETDNNCHNCVVAVGNFNIVLERKMNTTVQEICEEAKLDIISKACIQWGKMYLDDLDKRIAHYLNPNKVCKAAKICANVRNPSEPPVNVDFCSTCSEAVESVKSWVDNVGGVKVIIGEITKNICSIFPEDERSECHRRLKDNLLFAGMFVHNMMDAGQICRVIGLCAKVPDLKPPTTDARPITGVVSTPDK